MRTILFSMIVIFPSLVLGQNWEIVCIGTPAGQAYFHTSPADTAAKKKIDDDDFFVVFGFKKNERATDKWYKIYFKGEIGYTSYYTAHLKNDCQSTIDNFYPNLTEGRMEKVLKLDSLERILLIETAKLDSMKVDLIVKTEEAKLLAYAKYKFGVPAYYVEKSDYSFDFIIDCYNPIAKVIKYIFVTVSAFNRVDDLIGSKELKIVGPLENGEVAKARFEDVIYTRVFSYAKITKIKIQYMDNSVREIPREGIRLIVPPRPS